MVHLTFELVQILVPYHGWCCSPHPERPAKAPCQSTEHCRTIQNHRSLPGKSACGLKCQNNCFITLLLSPLLHLPTIYFASSTPTEFHRMYVLLLTNQLSLFLPHPQYRCFSWLLQTWQCSREAFVHLLAASLGLTWRHRVPWFLPWAALPNGFTFWSRRGSCFLQTDYELKYFPELLFTGFLMQWASA